MWASRFSHPHSFFSSSPSFSIMLDLHAFSDSDASLRSIHIDGYTFFLDETPVIPVVIRIQHDGHEYSSRDVPYPIRQRMTTILLTGDDPGPVQASIQLPLFPMDAHTFTSSSTLHYVHA